MECVANQKRRGSLIDPRLFLGTDQSSRGEECRRARSASRNGVASNGIVLSASLDHPQNDRLQFILCLLCADVTGHGGVAERVGGAEHGPQAGG